jgi:hypothetical protein
MAQVVVHTAEALTGAAKFSSEEAARAEAVIRAEAAGNLTRAVETAPDEDGTAGAEPARVEAPRARGGDDLVGAGQDGLLEPGDGRARGDGLDPIGPGGTTGADGAVDDRRAGAAQLAEATEPVDGMARDDRLDLDMGDDEARVRRSRQQLAALEGLDRRPRAPRAAREMAVRSGSLHQTLGLGKHLILLVR